MTRIVPDEPCQACGGMLVPSIFARRPQTLPPDTDYVCIECGNPHHWEGTPPKLVMIAPTQRGVRRD